MLILFFKAGMDLGGGIGHGPLNFKREKKRKKFILLAPTNKFF
jgi:hypothetical protein